MQKGLSKFPRGKIAKAFEGTGAATPRAHSDSHVAKLQKPLVRDGVGGATSRVLVWR